MKTFLIIGGIVLGLGLVAGVFMLVLSGEKTPAEESRERSEVVDRPRATAQISQVGRSEITL